MSWLMSIGLRVSAVRVGLSDLSGLPGLVSTGGCLILDLAGRIGPLAAPDPPSFGARICELEPSDRCVGGALILEVADGYLSTEGLDG